MNKFISFLGLVFLFSGKCSYAYEVDTHAEISDRAIDASRMSESLSAIGISIKDRLTPQAINLKKINDGSPKGWILEGAVLEDDTVGNSQQLARYLRHFYDPSHNGAGFLGLFDSSLVWGLEPNPIGSQDYSYPDARNYFYKGLTSAAKGEREKNLALTFRTIGQVIHLIQDLAQPQHTRNDSHATGSRYEDWANTNRSKLLYSGYGPVTFTNTTQFWHTPDGRGMADYSNRGFVTAGTNFISTGQQMFSDPAFPTPKAFDAKVFKKQITDPDLQTDCSGRAMPPNLRGEIHFIGTPLTDNYLGGQPDFNEKTSTYSIFNYDLKKTLGSLISYKDFSLNRFNFCEAQKRLIPRAVAYSTGLINYFFRGKIDMQRDRDNFFAYRIQNLGKETMNGTFRLYYDDEQNNRHLVKTWTGVTIDAGSEKGNFTFDAPTNPKPKNPDEYLLVFAGEMGQERPQGNSPGAVVSAVVKARPFVFFSGWRIDTDTDPIRSGSLMLFNYTIPEDLLLEFQNNFATIEMFIDDVLIPRIWISQGGCHSNLYCPSVFGQTADFVMEWQVQTMVDNGFVVYYGSSYSTVGYGLADWDNLHPEVCSRVLSSNGFYFLNYSPWVPHKIRLMISGKLAFEFLVEQGPNFQAVLSQTKNVRIHTKQCRLALKP